ncbi:hypothetical protein N5A71_004331 [Escherichia coli]|nr:hypothetical protein [Escherichia coli]EJL2123863.1 hypothetical protein [Escherichia coli]EJU6369170.1 hypothetical protein [Escherichia coli]
MAKSGYGLAGLRMGKVKSVNQYRLTPGFGGFTPVSHVTTACRLPCRWRGIRRKRTRIARYLFSLNYNSMTFGRHPDSCKKKHGLAG